MIRPRKERFNELFAAHPLKDMPNPSCEGCGGSGERVTTRNPKSKWDWWVIGGAHWDGWIYGPERYEQCREKRHDEFNVSNQHESLEDNCRPVKEIPIDFYYVPFAIITPDGEWHQQGQMGWWAIVSDSKTGNDWHEAVKKLLAQYSDHLAVTVDCHI